MKRKILWIALGAAVLTAAGLFAGNEAKYRFGKASGRDGTVLIPTGSDFTQLMDTLAADSVLRNPSVFRRIAAARGLAESVRPGRYEIKAGMTYARLIYMLKSGAQSPVRLTFNNLRTPDRLAGTVARKLEPDSLAFLQALTSDSVARAYGYTPATFMAMFIPNTYEFYWNTSPGGFLDRMQKESDKFWEPRKQKLSRTGLSREEAMTLASIVYEETKKKNEMPRVAGVYINRLKIGMPLQADPTVKFALGDFSLRRVLHKHLETDSPYNTYKHAGLPPGPICMPSIDAIDAVLDYEDHKYLYFCAKDDLSGYHNFAATLAEHNRNAQAYARALNRLKIK